MGELASSIDEDKVAWSGARNSEVRFVLIRRMRRNKSKFEGQDILE